MKPSRARAGWWPGRWRTALMRRIDAWPFRVQIGWLTAVIAAVVVLLALGLGWWALSLGAQRLLAAQERLLRPIVEAALLTPMIERDQATVAEVVRELVRGESIDRVVVLGHDGRVWQEAATPASLPLPWTREMRIPLTQGSLYFGEVRVRLNATALADAAVYPVASALVVLGVGVGVAVWLLLGWGRHVGARLARLEQAAQGLARGDFSQRAGGDDLGRDEIGQLGRVFDDMAARIGHTVDQLVVSESRVGAILQSIGDGLVATDAAMRVTYLNPIAQALTGWTEAEALGRPVSEIMRIANALTGQPVDLPIARVLETGHIVGLANHTELIARDGTRRHISDSAAPIRDASGTLVGVVMVFHDVSEAYRLRTSLEDSRTRLALALEASGFGLWDLQLTDDTVLLDQRARELLGVEASRTTVPRSEWMERIHPEDRMAAERRFSAHLAGEAATYESEFRVADGRGGWRWLGSRGRVTERLADGSPRRVTGTLADISERKAAQAQIQYLAFYDALTGLPNRRLLQDRLHQAEALARRVGERGALIFIDLDRFKHVNDSRGHAVGDGSPRRVTGTLADISERKAAQAQIQYLAFYDALTGLPNRRLLQDRLHQAEALARRVGERGALIFIDLDRFKHVNDSRGHAVGDQLLQQVAARLASRLRAADTLARLGGDEFVAIVTELPAALPVAGKLAHEVGDSLRQALHAPFDIDGASYHVTASVGIALFPDGNRSTDELLSSADAAMYAAKQQGRDRVCFFDPAMQQAATERLQLENDLHDALTRGELELYLQPQVDAQGRTVAAEALMRWRHPTKGLVNPGAFIPLAEETGLIVVMGDWMLQRACAILRRLDDAGLPIEISVNVSARQLQEADFVARLQRILGEEGVFASRLTLEITESMLLTDADQVVARLYALHRTGVKLSIDDFGTGYSSMAYLKQLPLHEIKIDRAFVDGLPDDANDSTITRAILGLARDFGLQVVAEGVETDAQAERLRALGCPRMQGYLFGRPQPAEHYLRQWLGH